VPEFETTFLELLRTTHQEDILTPLRSGKIDDHIANLITQIAQNLQPTHN